MTKKLLVDTLLFEVKPETISESMRNNGRIVVNGVLQRAEAKNQNGRVYPRAILEREAANYTKLIKERRALGELDHPDSSIVNLANVSHNIIEMHWEGNDLVGTVEILKTPAGNILRELFESKIKVGISSRGMGSTNEVNGVQEVQEDFELVAFDFVSNPSTHGAFLSPVNVSTQNTTNRIERDSKYDKIHSMITDIIIECKGV